MPQVRLEYSANLYPVDLEGVFKKIHQALAEITDIKTCKTREAMLKRYYIGNGETDSAIVHLIVELLPGRSEETKQKIGAELLKIINAAFEPVLAKKGLVCKPTVEIRTLQKYFIAQPCLTLSQRTQNIPSSTAEDSARLRAKL